MAQLILTAAVLLGFLAEAAFPQDADSVELAFVGSFLGPGPFPESGAGWFAVQQTSAGMLVTQTRIEVSQVSITCGGTGTRISAIDASEPLFLVRGIPSIQVGLLDSVSEEPRFIYPAQMLPFQLASGTWFGVQAYGSANPDVGGTRVSDYEIRLNQGMQTQTLAEFPVVDMDGPPQMLWAGDLDSDGDLDGLFDLRTHYAGHLYALFLSSRAEDDQLVRRVAEFPVSGC
jgi:hypothetical protein